MIKSACARFVEDENDTATLLYEVHNDNVHC